MAEITASQVKELRERTGAGMMECKKALTENDGNVEAAADWLRKTGLAKADKKASRVAAEGRIAMAQDAHKAVLVEINSETDFVAKDENFLKFANEVAQTALTSDAQDVEALKSANTSYGPTVDEGRQWLVAKVGENVQVRRMAKMESSNTIGAYVHGGRIGVLVEIKGANPRPGDSWERRWSAPTVDEGRQWLVAKVGENVQVRRMAKMESSNTIGAYVHGGRIGVLVEIKGGNAELARGLAMHIAAMNPPYISPAHVPADFVAREKEIAMAQVKDSGKPLEILEKMISGKVAKTVSEITLTGQPYVLDTNQTVEAALKAAGGAQVLNFVRLAVGEGIEKQADDFAAEVMKQAGLA